MTYETKLKFTKLVPKSTFLEPVILGVLIIPISMTFWIFGALGSSYFIGNDDSDTSPLRWLAAICIPASIVYRGLKKRSLNVSGALLGYWTGFILTLTSYAFMTSLLVFFVSSSWATKYKSHIKAKLEADFREGGQRNWLQVLCNGGVAAYLGVFYYIESGSGEFAIDFHNHHRRSWISLAILCAISCSNGDTWASEFGTVLTDETPRLITSGKKVPRGTNGGVTLVGVACSAAGGLAVGVGYYLIILLCVDHNILKMSPHQWPIIFVGLLGGLLGSILDSVLGATLQYSGLDEKTGAMVECPREGVKKISGSPWLDNHSVNLISSFVSAIFVPIIAHQFFWSY